MSVGAHGNAPNPRVTNYTYDALNRVSTVSRTGVGTLASYSYDAIGNISQVTRANGIKSTFGYDDLHRLTAIQHKKGTEVLSQFNYALSADGKRNTLQEYLKYPAGQPVSEINRTVFYGYDNAGRLTAEQRQSTSTLTAGGTQKNTARTVWSYDKVGNRLTQAVSNYDGLGVPGDPGATGVLKSTFNTDYNYNINDWLTSTTAVKNDDTGESTYTSNFEYNANGSQTAVTSNAGKPDETRVPYFYDFEQKLTAIGNAGDSIHHNYGYDADGNRIAESNTNAGVTNTEKYLVDPNNSNAQIVEEYDNANKLLAHYDWNDAELLREAAWNANTNSYDIREPLADGHNSTRELLDNTGSVSDLYSFDAWGNQQVNVGSSVNPYRYNSQRLDASGLYYLRARQYVSGTGRFLTHDPLMGNTNDPITQHRYLYAGNDAVNMVDPSGLFSMGEQIEVGSIASTEMGQLSPVIARQIAEVGFKIAAKQLARRIALGAAITALTVSVADDSPESKEVLFHYTDEKGLAAILAQQSLKPTIGEPPLAMHGNGIYLTDLPPVGLLRKSEYGIALFRIARMAWKTKAWIALDVSDLQVQRTGNIYLSNLSGTEMIDTNRAAQVQNFSHFLYPTTMPISLIKSDGESRVVASGSTLYHP